MIEAINLAWLRVACFLVFDVFLKPADMSSASIRQISAIVLVGLIVCCFVKGEGSIVADNRLRWNRMSAPDICIFENVYKY